MDASTRARDEWLALRCQAREPRAFEDLMAQTERPLFYYAVKLTGSEDAARDALQEVWLRAMRGIAKLHDPSSVRAWLYTMVHGIVVDTFRRARTRERAEEAHAESAEETCAPAFESDDAEAVHRALDRLEPRHRDPLVLYFMEDFSVSEIARIVGCPEGTVKSRLHYAKRALRDIISGENNAR